jgi:hypothetical protein
MTKKKQLEECHNQYTVYKKQLKVSENEIRCCR